MPLILTVALLLRVYLLVTVLEPIEGDEAVLGTMSLTLGLDLRHKASLDRITALVLVLALGL